MNLAERLQELRKQNGMSQETLAEKLNVSRQAISKWESGTARPDLSKLIELSRFYSVSVDELLGGESATEPEMEQQFGRYTEPHSEKPRKRWLVWGAVALVVISWIVLGSRIERLEDRIDGLTDNLMMVRDDLSYWMNAAQNSGNTADDSQENELISEWRVESGEADLIRQQIPVSFYLTPKNFTESMTVELNLLDTQTEDAKSVILPLEKNGYIFFVQDVLLPLSDEITISAVLDYGEEKRLVKMDSLTGLKSKSMLYLTGLWSGTTGSFYENDQYVGLRLDGELAMDLDVPMDELVINEGVVELLINGTVVEAQQIDTVFFNRKLQSLGNTYGGQYELGELKARVPCADGDEFELRIRLTDELGIQYIAVAHAGTYFLTENGKPDIVTDEGWSLEHNMEIVLPEA